MLKQLLESYKEEMKSDLATLVSFNSVNEPASENAPFGLENAKCLDAALKMAEKCGMTAHNLDYHIGYGEVGSGKEVIGILGHLDIVPVGDGWNTEPLVLTEVDNKLYGRGVSDDKGALVAAAYAIRILNDMGVEMNKRVRLIMGCNEENGSKCLKHYVAKEGHVDYGFTPDASFPGIFGEKGMVAAKFHMPSTKILSIAGGSVTNVVCAQVKAEFALGSVDVEKVKSILVENGLSVEVTTAETVMMSVKGVAAHASTPHLGINAVSHLMNALELSGFEDEFVSFYNKHIGLVTDGSKCNVEFADDYGPLTFNNGVISMENGVITGTIDIRFPVTMKAEVVKAALIEGFSDAEGTLEVLSTVEAAFYPKDSDLVNALVKAYRTVTNDTESEPGTMGGGTYAKSINNIVAFGCAFKDDTHIHDANEVMNVDEFYLQVEIYVEAIKNLLAL